MVQVLKTPTPRITTAPGPGVERHWQHWKQWVADDRGSARGGKGEAGSRSHHQKR
jgi:hypothetical protein